MAGASSFVGHPAPVQQLARDSAINVLANLIAGAAIYVGGLLLGVFPRITGLLFLALVILVIVHLAVGTFLYRAFRPLSQEHFGLLLLESGIALYALATLAGIGEGDQSWTAWAGFGLYVFCVSSSCVLAFKNKGEKLRREEHAARRMAYKDRPQRLRSSRSPRIVRRQRLSR